MAITLNGSGITSANIADGTIVNADINSSAAIAASKLTGTGKVLQVVSGSISSALSTSSTSFADMSASLSKSMTLSSSSNKVLVFVGINGGYRSSGSGATSPEFIITDSSNVTISTMSGMSFHTLGAGYSSGTQVAFTYLWSPGITSITVKCRWKSPSGDSYNVNENSHGGTPSTSTITLMEIGA
jgi:hypothetical protein